MANIIHFKKEEKLAILRIMVEINNHYNSRFSIALKVIQDISILFNLPNGISEAYNLSILDAKNILILDDHNKKYFIEQILGYMLMTSNFGVCKTAKELDEELDKNLDLISEKYENAEEILDENEDKLYKEYFSKIELLCGKFKEEWKFVFELFPIDRTTINSILLDTINPFDSSCWTIIKEDENEAKLDGIKPTVSQKIDIQNRPQSDVIKEEYKLPKEFIDIIRKELKAELLKELKDLVRKEINEKFHEEMKNIMNNNLNETLYKDL